MFSEYLGDVRDELGRKEGGKDGKYEGQQVCRFVG